MILKARFINAIALVCRRVAFIFRRRDLLVCSTTSPEYAFPTLWSFIGGCFHQDVDLEADTIAEVVADFSRRADASIKHSMLTEMAVFEHKYKDDLKGSFVRVFDLEHEINPAGDDVSGFFAMVRAILADPSVYVDYESGKDFG